MLSKTIIAAAALAATVAAQSAEDFPSCWATCFAEYNIQSQDCLCKDDLKDVVSSCVASGCEEADTDAYEAWLSSYCYVAPVSSNTWPVPSSVIPLPSSYAVPSEPASYPAPEPSDPASYPAPSEPASYPASYTDPVTSEPWSYTYSSEAYSSETTTPCTTSTEDPVPSYYPTGTAVVYPSYSACTSYSTYIYRSQTTYESYPVTSTYTEASGTWAAATGTAGVYPSASYYDPVPATGSAAKSAKLAGVSFGVAGLVAGLAAVLL